MLSHYINNHWQPGEGEEFQSINPATSETIWTGNAAEKEEIDAAIHAARAAFSGWANTPIEKRIEHIEAFQQILSERKEDLALVISKETGKPLWEARTEVNAMIDKVRISKESQFQRCAELTRPQGIFTSYTRHKPHGVVAVFGPYNFPGHLPNGHIIPALIAGNTVIFKPSQLTPHVAETVIRFWEDCHLPKGVINLLQGSEETGKHLAEHKGIDGLFFTGSWNTGLQLSKLFARRPEKILALEMGGNNPYIIGNISDFDAAAYLTIQSAFITTGQRCTCARRLIIPKGEIGDTFLETLIPMIDQLSIGPYTNDPEPYMGPLISKEAAQNTIQKYKDMIEREAKPLYEMRAIKGAFLTPGLIDVTYMQNREDEEIFGPLLQVIRVPDFDAAIEEANNTDFGLATGLLSDDREQYDEFFARSHAGVINWNAPLTGASSSAPFGGIGHSGNHRPSAYYAADYCNYPVASLEIDTIKIPENVPPGIQLPTE